MAAHVRTNHVHVVVDAEVRPESRLSCQIIVSDAIDGLVVHMPDRQY